MMKLERRNFLKKIAGVCAAGVGTKVGIFAAATPAAAAVAATASGIETYGFGVRGQVFEVIVRQAMTGAPWRDICSGPMQVSNIDPKDVEAEVARRRVHRDSVDCKCLLCEKLHKNTLDCQCDACKMKRKKEIEIRFEESKRRKARIDAIAHSETSPCACKSCRAHIKQVLVDVGENELFIVDDVSLIGEFFDS